MKRSISLALLATLLLTLFMPLAIAATQPAPVAKSKAPGAPVAAAISTVTGIAISPLLGTGAYGAFLWFKADEAGRAKLPWYAQMKFWLPALLIVGACALKDAAGATIPVQMKKPFDVIETLENKISGLVAAGAVVPITVDTFTNAFLGHDPSAGITLVPSGLAMVQVGAINGAWFLNVLAIPIAVVMFAVVWLASHAINVLILLSPWGAIDAALKGARTALLGSVVATSAIDPWTGAMLSLLIVVIAYLLAGWAFRLTVYGSLFCWDFVTVRSGRFTPKENDNAMFAGAFFQGVPARSYGRLVQRTEGGLEFLYRPWPWLPKRTAAVTVPKEKLVVGRGLFFSEIQSDEGKTIFLLPPRYRGHEEQLARVYLLAGVKPAGLRKAWSELRELFGGRAVKAA